MILDIDIDPKLQTEVEQILAKAGLSPEELVKLLYEKIKQQKILPFKIETPNTETLAAIKEAEHPEKLKSYPNVDAMFSKWEKE